MPRVNQATTIGLTRPNLESGPASATGYETGHLPAKINSYQFPVFNWKAYGPAPELQYDAGPNEGYGQESGLSDVSDAEDWSSEEYRHGGSEHSREESSSQSSGGGSGPESGPKSGHMTQYIDAPRPLSAHGDAGPDRWHHQGGCRIAAPFVY